ncbi:MAG TPA: type II 3-dehydroquinate dehydratase, partial [Polyangia bacterium]|nr:type II 3-dehydroquinate dehydratase [Polyangia bacterium]
MAKKTALPTVVVLHGPNLNLLGEREPHVYGNVTLAEIDAALTAAGKAAGVAVRTAQSNHEGALIDLVQQARVDA